MKATDSSTSRIANWWLTGLLLMATLAPDVYAGARTSARYDITADTVDSGGQPTASADYSGDGSVGGAAGSSQSVSFGLNSGFIAQLVGDGPVVFSVSPTGGPSRGGTSVTITGQYLTGATAVQFGGLAGQSFTVDSDTQITAIAPAGTPGTVDITVITPFGTSATRAADQFTYIGSADLSVTVSAPAIVNPGNELAYTITVSNAGRDAAASVRLTDQLPAGMTFVSLAAPDNWSATTPVAGAGGTVVASTGALAAGSTVSFTLTVQVAGDAGVGTIYSDSGSVASGTTDTNPDNNSAATATTVTGAPSFTAPLQSQSASAGGSVSLTAGTAGYPLPALQWERNGSAIAGATGPVLALTNLQSAETGLYSVTATNSVSAVTSDPAIVGVLTTDKVSGDGVVVGTDILHPNGNHYDQVLMTGPAVAVTADPGKVTRTSFNDLNDDIVQVEFSGHGTLAIVLDDPSGPAAPLNYNQPDVSYMKGHAGIVIAGADETTHVTVYTIGRATAWDPTGAYDITKPIGVTNDPANNGSPLFIGHDATAYDGIADIAFIAILSTDGKFGGLRAGNVHFFAPLGYTGVDAPGVAFQGPVYIGNIDANGSATPMIIVGSTSDARIAGGNLLQTNAEPVQVSGLTHLVFTAGSDSQGNVLPAQDNRAVLEDNGQDVTSQIVVNPQ